MTDSFNLTVSANTTFQTTWVGVPAYTYTSGRPKIGILASGMYVDNPDLCNAPGDPTVTSESSRRGKVWTSTLTSSYGPLPFYRGAP